MGALLLLSMMAMPLAEAQYGPNCVAAFGPVSSGVSMFRSVLDPQLELGPTDLQQVRRHMIAHSFHTHTARDIDKSLGCPVAFALSP